MQLLQHEMESVLTDEISWEVGSCVLSHNCVDSEPKLSLHTFNLHPILLFNWEWLTQPKELICDLPMNLWYWQWTMHLAFLFFRASSLTPGSKLSNLKRESLLVPCSKLSRYPGGQLTFQFSLWRMSRPLLGLTWSLLQRGTTQVLLLCFEETAHVVSLTLDVCYSASVAMANTQGKTLSGSLLHRVQTMTGQVHYFRASGLDARRHLISRKWTRRGKGTRPPWTKFSLSSKPVVVYYFLLFLRS